MTKTSTFSDNLISSIKGYADNAHHLQSPISTLFIKFFVFIILVLLFYVYKTHIYVFLDALHPCKPPFPHLLTHSLTD